MNATTSLNVAIVATPFITMVAVTLLLFLHNRSSLRQAGQSQSQQLLRWVTGVSIAGGIILTGLILGRLFAVREPLSNSFFRTSAYLLFTVSCVCIPYIVVALVRALATHPPNLQVIREAVEWGIPWLVFTALQYVYVISQPTFDQHTAFTPPFLGGMFTRAATYFTSRKLLKPVWRDLWIRHIGKEPPD